MPDSGVVFIDQNAARNPRSPLEPLFRALSTENPKFNIADVDLVTDRNNIRKLLRFVQGTSNDPFQIRVEIAGQKTALFTRVEAKTKELIRRFRGFGHAFEDAYTQKPSGNTGHHRIVGYSFGGLRCVVRHETDGYVEDGSSRELTDDLSDSLAGLAISSPDIPNNLPGAVVVKLDGKPVERTSTLEIKTRTANRVLDMAEVSSQLWISQTPKLVAGYHRNGLFGNVQLKDMTEHLREWETANQKSLCTLASLLAKIIRAVSSIGDRSAIILFAGGTKLSILGWATGSERSLPGDLYAKWESGGDGDIGDSAQSGEGATTKVRSEDSESQAKGKPSESGQDD
jgi:hypothetical protein